MESETRTSDAVPAPRRSEGDRTTPPIATLPPHAALTPTTRLAVSASPTEMIFLWPAIRFFLAAAQRVTTVMGDRGFRGLAGPLAREHGVETVIKFDPDRPKGEFRPLQPLWKVEAAFSELGR